MGIAKAMTKIKSKNVRQHVKCALMTVTQMTVKKTMAKMAQKARNVKIKRARIAQPWIAKAMTKNKSKNVRQHAACARMTVAETTLTKTPVKMTTLTTTAPRHLADQEMAECEAQWFFSIARAWVPHMSAAAT